MIKSFSHIYLPVLDMGESIRFYTENLGFEMFRRWSSAPGREAAYVRLGEVLLEMSLVQPENRQEALRGDGKFGLVVTGLDALLDELRSKGVEVLPEGPPMRSFTGRQVRIKDPSGWQVALREWGDDDGPLNDNWKPQT